MSKETITLDCPPGSPRPGDLIEGVIKDTKLKLENPISKTFGEWVWEFDVDHAEWLKIQPILKKRITELYSKGLIRYGDW